MKKKKLFFVIILIIILVVVLVIFKLTKKTDVNGDLENTLSQEDLVYQGDMNLDIFEEGEIISLEDEKEYKGLVLSNIELQMISERECEIRADVRNETNEMIEMQDIKIKIYDDNRKFIRYNWSAN